MNPCLPQRKLIYVRLANDDILPVYVNFTPIYSDTKLALELLQDRIPAMVIMNVEEIRESLLNSENKYYLMIDDESSALSTGI